MPDKRLTHAELLPGLLLNIVVATTNKRLMAVTTPTMVDPCTLINSKSMLTHSKKVLMTFAPEAY